MWPTLLRIGNFEITTFGLMMFLAFVVGGWVLTKRFRAIGYTDDDASGIIVAAALGGIAGAKIYYGILYHDLSLIFSRAGLVWYGGFIGGVLASWFVARRRRLDFLRVADASSPALAIGYALGRVGCFLVGDDYGAPTESVFGIAFPNGAPPTTAANLRGFGSSVDPTLPGDTLLRVHPTQLYETAMALMIFAILVMISRRTSLRGRLFGCFLVLAGVERFAVELLRAKDDRFLGPFTVAQVISVLILVAGTILILRSRDGAEKIPQR